MQPHPLQLANHRTIEVGGSEAGLGTLWRTTAKVSAAEASTANSGMDRVQCSLIALVSTVIIVYLFFLTWWQPVTRSSTAWTDVSPPSLLNLTVKKTVGGSDFSPIFNLRQAVGRKDFHNALCVAPSGGFKAWQQDTVTVLEPPIARNCTKVFNGDKTEIGRIHIVSRKWQNGLSDLALLNLTSNCSWVLDYFSDNLYATKLERSFPIAYSFVIYNQPQQFLRLFRFLYKPFNTYCIHPDKKSPPLFQRIIENIANCLQNTFIASKLIDVQYAKPSLLEAQMSCMMDLVRLRDAQSEQVKWNYVINLCGKELPLASPHEIVTHLRRAEGSSVIRARRVKPDEKKTVRRLHGRRIPHNLQLYKGLAYMAISYQFANFLLTNKTAIEVHEFFKTCDIPEEHFYSTLYKLPGVPGGFNKSIPSDFFHVIAVFWADDRVGWSQECAGETVHGICIVATGNWKEVVARSRDGEKSLFHNKYFMEQDHVVMDCMEERLVARNKDEFKSDCLIT